MTVEQYFTIDTWPRAINECIEQGCMGMSFLPTIPTQSFVRRVTGWLNRMENMYGLRLDALYSAKQTFAQRYKGDEAVSSLNEDTTSDITGENEAQSNIQDETVQENVQSNNLDKTPYDLITKVDIQNREKKLYDTSDSTTTKSNSVGTRTASTTNGINKSKFDTDIAIINQEIDGIENNIVRQFKYKWLDNCTTEVNNTLPTA